MARRRWSKILIVCFVSTILLGSASACSTKNKVQPIDQEASGNNTMVTEQGETKRETKLEFVKLSLVKDHPNDPMSMDFNSMVYTAQVKPYQVKADLSNVENAAQLGDFTAEQKELLSKNSFCVVPTKEEQLFYIYEKNEYLKIPSFVTTDSVLQAYHLFFDFSLRTLESEKLFYRLELLTSSMLNKSIIAYNQVNNPVVKEAARKNIAYFAVAQTLLKKQLPDNMPAEAKVLSDKELLLIQEKKGITESPIFKYNIDYSQFTPRGHYTRSEEFKNYFRATMWYGQAPFVLFKEGSDEKELNLEPTLQALLMTYTLYCENSAQIDIDLWESIYNPTELYVGKSDDLTIYNYKKLLMDVYGEDINLEKLTNEDKLQLLIKEGQKLPEPQIKAKWVTASIPVGKQFRLMGQRYIPDSEIFQTLTEPNIRPFPKGLDVMGVLGSARAKDILLNDYKENEKWSNYTKNFNMMKNKFDGLSQATWKSNLYYGWLWTLKPLLKNFGDGFPSFMRNSAWQDKSLSTALASWSELRHNTILYAKPFGAECGGEGEPPVIKSYVEPNVDFYDRLIWLTQYSRKNLGSREILTGELESKLQSLEDMLTFLRTCAIKELRNEELSKQEYYQLLIYGGNLEHLSSRLAGGVKGWFEITSETDRNMAVIADVQSTSISYLEEGVGTAAQIFVVVPIGNKYYLTRGAVFQYYEFESSKRLTDEEWQQMLKKDNAPSQPEWTKSFTNGSEKTVPTPIEPYNSGC